MTPKHAARLISLMGWGFIIFGFIYVTIAFPAFDSFAKKLSHLFDWTGLTAADDLSRSARWLAAIMSGLSAGFGAFYVFIVAPLVQYQDVSVFHTIKRGGLIAAGLWFVIDSTGSVAAGVPSNVAPNLLFLAMYAVPLILVKYEIQT